MPSGHPQAAGCQAAHRGPVETLAGAALALRANAGKIGISPALPAQRGAGSRLLGELTGWVWKGLLGGTCKYTKDWAAAGVSVTTQGVCVNSQSFSPYRPPGRKPKILEGARGEEREKAEGGKGGLNWRRPLGQHPQASRGAGDGAGALDMLLSDRFLRPAQSEQDLLVSSTNASLFLAGGGGCSACGLLLHTLLAVSVPAGGLHQVCLVG